MSPVLAALVSTAWNVAGILQTSTDWHNIQSFNSMASRGWLSYRSVRIFMFSQLSYKWKAFIEERLPIPNGLDYLSLFFFLLYLYLPLLKIHTNPILTSDGLKLSCSIEDPRSGEWKEVVQLNFRFQKGWFLGWRLGTSWRVLFQKKNPSG